MYACGTVRHGRIGLPHDERRDRDMKRGESDSPNIPKPRGRKTVIKSVHNFKPMVPYEKRFDKVAHMPVRGSSRRCAYCSTEVQPHGNVLNQHLGFTTLVHHQLVLKDQEPVRLPPYRLSPPRMQQLKAKIQEMLHKGIIRPSTCYDPYFLPGLSPGTLTQRTTKKLIHEMTHEGSRPTSRLLASRPYAEAEVDDHPNRMEKPSIYYGNIKKISVAAVANIGTANAGGTVSVLALVLLLLLVMVLLLLLLALVLMVVIVKKFVALQPMKGQDRPACCWSHVHMPKHRWTIIQPE
ncbi:hypothetical protein ANN_13718 [Periplaneta americana]|uniref:Uncharacterized protein n=1 Tax=Periplaneta americana TaxID=6978 RepID=A0ABQ8SVL8_PERAM|nr:hypothetical protein ANN_13718 [Periplaneta americana]